MRRISTRTAPAGLGYLALAFSLLGSPAATAVEPDVVAERDDDWRIERLADGVWAALQPADRRFDDSNSLIVVGEDGALVVDSQATLERTQALIDRVRGLTSQPVRWLVNTHWHGDHTNGNSAWLEAFAELTIIGHDTSGTDIVERAMPDHRSRIERWDAAIAAAAERLARGVDRDDAPLDADGTARLAADIDDARRRVDAMQAIRAEPPRLTLDGTLTIRLGRRVVELRPYRAHTRGDVIVLVPDAAVIASGDLLDDLPYGGHGYPSSWLAALDRIDRLEFETIVPGHGPVMRGRARLELIRELLIAALDGAAIDDPALVELRRRFVEDDPIALRNWNGFIPALLERVAAERADSLD